MLFEILFLLATFFTAVTALNMLIAIMGDTFEKVLDGYEHHSREMKLKILKDYMHNIEKENEQKSNFIVLVTPAQAIEEDWNGAINTIKADAKASHDQLLEKFNAKIDIVQESMKDLKASTLVKDKDVRKMISDLLRN